MPLEHVATQCLLGDYGNKAGVEAHLCMGQKKQHPFIAEIAGIAEVAVRGDATLSVPSSPLKQRTV